MGAPYSCVHNWALVDLVVGALCNCLAHLALKLAQYKIIYTLYIMFVHTTMLQVHTILHCKTEVCPVHFLVPISTLMLVSVHIGTRKVYWAHFCFYSVEQEAGAHIQGASNFH